jgi:archaellum biogenesis ATPase FlaH
MLALYRLNRIQEFLYLQRIYLLLIDSFMSYGMKESREILDQLLAIPWFSDRKRSLLHTIASYRQLLEGYQKERQGGYDRTAVSEYKQNTIIFVDAFKQLIDFDEKDETRISSLIENQTIIDDALENLFRDFQINK